MQPSYGDNHRQQYTYGELTWNFYGRYIFAHARLSLPIIFSSLILRCKPQQLEQANPCI